MPFALPDEGRHRDRLVAVLFDGLDLAFTHADRQTEAFADLHRAIGGAARTGDLEHLLRETAQLFGRISKQMGS